MKKKSAKQLEATQKKLTFRTVKGADFRVINGTGLIVHEAPSRGQTRLTLYCDRFPFENEIEYEFLSTDIPGQGRIGKKLSGKEGGVVDVKSIERELQVEVNISNVALMEVALQIGNYLKWLQEQPQSVGQK